MGVSSGAEHVVRALRNRRDEAQLTRVVAAFASQDPVLAGGLAKIMVSAAGRESSDARSLLSVIPRELECTHEVALADIKGRPRGFVDLMFRDGTDFVLLVENKLGSEYRYDQIPDYLAGLEARPGKHKGLLSVTRKRPLHEEKVPPDPKWLGSIRWARIAEELRDLKPGDDTLTLLWSVLLEVLSQDGDLGVVDLKPELLDAWVKFDEAHEALQLLMQDLADHALGVTRQKLGARLGRDPGPDLAEVMPHPGRYSPVWPHHTRVHLRIAIPGDSDYERLRIQFINFDDVTFTVEARHELGRELPAAAQAKLRNIGGILEQEKHFAFDSRKLEYLSHLHSQDKWAKSTGDESLAVLRDFIERDMSTLVDAGVFDPEFDLP